MQAETFMSSKSNGSYRGKPGRYSQDRFNNPMTPIVPLGMVPDYASFMAMMHAGAGGNGIPSGIPGGIAQLPNPFTPPIPDSLSYPRAHPKRKINRKSSYNTLSPSITAKTVNPLETWDALKDRPNRPGIDGITKIHVYDFDNTLFKTPLPNPAVICGSTIGMLQSSAGLHQGGWWADPRFLMATGEGYKIEKDRAWEGWWNEMIVSRPNNLKSSFLTKVSLARDSIQDPHALTIALTGRKHSRFSTCVQEMLQAKKLEFDGVVLRRGDADSTLTFKNQVITDFLTYYSNAVEITLYDDRPHQAIGFRRSLKEFSEMYRKELNYEVIEVVEDTKYLDPVAEKDLILSVIRAHNEALQNGTLHSSVPRRKLDLRIINFHLGYILDLDCSIDLLRRFAAQIPFSHNVRCYGSSIVISWQDLSQNDIKLLGGLGAKVAWKITHFGSFNDRIWAVKVEPIDASLRVQTESTVSMVVLALRKKASINECSLINDWQQVPDNMVLNTEIGYKGLLKITGTNDQPKRYELSNA